MAQEFCLDKTFLFDRSRVTENLKWPRGAGRNAVVSTHVNTASSGQEI